MMSISDIHLFTEIDYLNTHADVKQCVSINSGAPFTHQAYICSQNVKSHLRII